jgi:hypothetical protein
VQPAEIIARGQDMEDQEKLKRRMYTSCALVRAASVLWCWGRVLWVCRVPLVSVVGGGALLVMAPQVLDLFADRGLRWWEWLIFLLLVALWAHILHAVARNSLQRDDWAPANSMQYDDGRTRHVPTHVRNEFECPAILVPRLIGVSAFLVVGWAICRARRNLLTAVSALQEAERAVFVTDFLLVGAIAMAVIYSLVFWSGRPAASKLAQYGQQSRRIDHENRAARIAGAVCNHVPQPAPPLLTGKQPFSFPLSLFVAPPAGSHVYTWVDKVLMIIGSLLTVGFVFTIVTPHSVADWLPRALFLPILLGGWVIFAGEIAAWSHRWRTPLFVILFFVAITSVWLFGHFHDVRWAAAPPAAAVTTAPPLTRNITLTEGVQRWKALNHCEETCNVRPIIVAGAGGASRAAFLTATVVGAMIDLGRDDPARFGNVRNRLFALSTVSGSSLAAVVMRAALTDAADGEHIDEPPCRKESQGAWYGSRRALADNPDPGFDPTRSWRSCFQQLVAGDFLSAVVAGLAYRDNFIAGNPVTGRAFWPDRAVLLEQAFERRYYQVTEKGALLCDETFDTGLCRRFGYHPDPQKNRGAWLPLLFINGTSVATGRRIILGDVPANDDVANDQVLFPLAYDLMELRRESDGTAAHDPKEQARDLYLSTAATMSARFPLISPHGLIRDHAGHVVDRIVDGGYFENDGLATAADLVRILEQEHKLHPVVIRIVNEPVLHVPHALGKQRPDLPVGEEAAFFDVFSSIFRTLVATRSGHEDGHAEYLINELGRNASGGSDRLIEINVRPLDSSPVSPKNPKYSMCRHVLAASKERSFMKSVSMSWWISQPVQAYLDAQLCSPDNTHPLECELIEHPSPDDNCPPHANKPSEPATLPLSTNL